MSKTNRRVTLGLFTRNATAELATFFGQRSVAEAELTAAHFGLGGGQQLDTRSLDRFSYGDRDPGFRNISLRSTLLHPGLT